MTRDTLYISTLPPSRSPISRRRPRLLSPEVRIIMFGFIDSGAPWAARRAAGWDGGGARGRRRRTWRYQGVCMKVSTRCDIGAALLFARRKSSREPSPRDRSAAAMTVSRELGPEGWVRREIKAGRPGPYRLSRARASNFRQAKGDFQECPSFDSPTLIYARLPNLRDTIRNNVNP